MRASSTVFFFPQLTMITWRGAPSGSDWAAAPGRRDGF